VNALAFSVTESGACLRVCLAFGVIYLFRISSLFYKNKKASDFSKAFLLTNNFYKIIVE